MNTTTTPVCEQEANLHRALRIVYAGEIRCVRRAARDVGLVARRSKSRFYNNKVRGSYMLIEPSTKFVVAGFDFDLTMDDVLDLCDALESAATPS